MGARQAEGTTNCASKRTAASRLMGLGVLALASALVILGWWQRTGPSVNGIEEPSMPTKSELTAVDETRVLFGHQSVGMNILGGVASIYDKSDVRPPRIEQVDGTEDVAGQGVLAHAFIGVNGDPLGKIQAFANLMSSPVAQDMDVALMKFCYVDIGRETDAEALFNAYSRTMDRLEAEHPDITFLYTTAPLMSDPPRTAKALLKTLVGRGENWPADNVVRERYNQLVRDKYAASGRLFDIAAVESTMKTDPLERSSGGQQYYVLHRDLTADGGHLNAAGAQRVAAELIQLIAAQVRLS